MALAPLHAATGSEGAAFLEIPVGAGPAAMGSAYTALAGDAYAPVWNPAGLGEVSGTQIAAQHLAYLESLNYEFISAVHAVGEGKAIGVSGQYVGSGNFRGMDNQGNPTGSFGAHYGAYSAAYGQRVGAKLALGLTAKWINAKLDDASANAYAADIGAWYRLADPVTLAFTATNLGSKLTFSQDGDRLPQEFHLAATYRLRWRCTLAAEGVHNQTGLTSGRFGGEWRPMEMIALRAGYKTETTKGLTAMAGLTTGIGLHVMGQEFAYAWLPYGDLGSTHYFSLVLRFGNALEQQKNLVENDAARKRDLARRTRGSTDNDEEDPEYQQLKQLLSDQADRNALAPLTNPRP